MFPEEKICGFVNDVLHIREREKSLFRREPVKRSHGKVVIESVPNSKLPAEVNKGIETADSIEILVVLPVASFDLAVVPGSKRLYGMVPDPEPFKREFKKGFFVSRYSFQTISEFRTVVGLNTFDGIRKPFYAV